MVDKGLKSKFARVLGICRTALYRESTKQQERDAVCVEQLKAVHAEEPYYGVQRLAIELGWSQKKTRRIRNLAKVTVKRRKKRTRRQQKPEIPAPDNLLRCHYALRDAAHPEKGYTFRALTNPKLKIWVQDFTYIRWHGKFYYLACVKELSTSRILGWCMSTHHNADMVHKALSRALAHYSPPTIAHSDRGSEYLSIKHANLCQQHHIAMSASAAGKPPENGFMESFFNSFKTEMQEHITNCTSETELYASIAGWIDYYNNFRIHTTLKMPPATYAHSLCKAHESAGSPQLILSPMSTG